MDEENLAIVCDNIVTDASGKPRIVESMSSAVCDLSQDHEELIARLHPVKKKFFDAVDGGQAVSVKVSSRSGPNQALLQRDIELRVNGAGGQRATVKYRALAGRVSSSVLGEAWALGFDSHAEPLLRQMQDRSFRLIFCTMPPTSHRLGAAFDVDHFGQTLVASVSAKVSWDDRDVLYIAPTGAHEVRQILSFLYHYGDAATAQEP